MSNLKNDTVAKEGRITHRQHTCLTPNSPSFDSWQSQFLFRGNSYAPRMNQQHCWALNQKTQCLYFTEKILLIQKLQKTKFIHSNCSVITEKKSYMALGPGQRESGQQIFYNSDLVLAGGTLVLQNGKPRNLSDIDYSDKKTNNKARAF